MGTKSFLIISSTAETLGTYEEDFYSGTPAVTVNSYGKGKAYYVAFANEGDFFESFIEEISEKLSLEASPFATPEEVSIIRRGVIFSL